MSLLRIRASEAREGDELLSGPQGPVDGAPTIDRIEQRSDWILVVSLVDDGPIRSTVLWQGSSPLAVHRPG